MKVAERKILALNMDLGRPCHHVYDMQLTDENDEDESWNDLAESPLQCMRRNVFYQLGNSHKRQIQCHILFIDLYFPPGVFEGGAYFRHKRGGREAVRNT